ncbi:hypothetical protein [Segatella copri]|uniref:hypothetical protein n=1 Tax=Segatella copri TaxID=165179 RepID=UPI001291B67D|nr:hypothetical protein [Segatella copri]MQM89987.1 hypothetical protein [Segatella copri]MQM97431.1 hypothetical protein [Segatella copri]MQN03094.1 hypothetical protein [Segatella copri]MQO39401.1 hypothetical protein [Segatella copri]
MKEIKLYIGIIAVLLTAMLTGCSDSIADSEPSKDETEEGYYTASFNVSIPNFEQQVTRSTVFMNEGIPKDSMKLFCFDNEGQFIGFGKVTEFDEIKGFTRDNNGTIHDDGDIHPNGSTDLHNFHATIPNQTSRIHLVANTGSQYQTINWGNQANWVGMHENMLMTTFETEHGEDQAARVRYWGYIKKDSPEELKEYLKPDTKKKDYIIHLIRDRAKISADWSDAVKKANPGIINDFKMTVINGVAYGTLAPFNRDSLLFNPTTGDDKWVWKVNYVTPSINTRRLKGDVGQMFNPTGAFEEHNLPTDPAKVILWHDGLYYLIYLQDSKNKPYAIKRNYEYKIIIDKLDKSYGNSNSEVALKGAPANNPWIRVEQIVPGITDGNYELAIVGGTYKTVNTGENTEQMVQFTYKGDDAANKQPKAFVALWTENLSFATADAPEVTDYTYDKASKTGTGTIKYKLDKIDKTWREGIIYLTDTVHGLNRNIHLYSVSEANYDIQDANISATLNSEGDFTITIPKDYPDGLLPVNFKIASNDINPKDWKVEIGNTETETDNDCKTGSWFTYKAEVIQRNSGTLLEEKGKRTYTYTFKLRNVRKNAKKGDKGYFWLKADNFNQGKAKKFEFTYQ